MKNEKLNAYEIEVTGSIVVSAYTTIYAENDEEASAIAATIRDHNYKCEEILDAEHDCQSQDWQGVMLRVRDKHLQEVNVFVK